MSKQTYHHGDLYSTLIDSAERLLDSKGPDALSLRALAREAGVSQTAPYRHFEDKNALLIKVATRGFDDFALALQTAVDENANKQPKQQLAALSQAYIDFALNRSGVFHLMFLSDLLLYGTDETMGRSAIASYKVLCKIVAECQGKDDVEPSDATVIASWAMMHGLAMLLTHNVIHPNMSGGMTKEQVVDALVQMMFFKSS